MKRGKVSDIKIENVTTIACPHCGEDVNVKPGSLMGKLSGQSRIGQSVMMRELVELRWAKQSKKKVVSRAISKKAKPSKVTKTK